MSVTVGEGRTVVGLNSGPGVAVGDAGVIFETVEDVSTGLVTANVGEADIGGGWVEVARFASSAAMVKAAAVGKYSGGNGVDKSETSGVEQPASISTATNITARLPAMMDVRVGLVTDSIIRLMILEI